MQGDSLGCSGVAAGASGQNYKLSLQAVDGNVANSSLRVIVACIHASVRQGAWWALALLADSLFSHVRTSPLPAPRICGMTVRRSSSESDGDGVSLRQQQRPDETK